MKNKIYLHSSDLKNIGLLNSDHKFEPTFQYDKFEEIHQNEWGRIKTPHTNYHILIGNIRQFFCPWCATEPEYKVDKCFDGRTRHYFECPSCGSTGPIKFMYINDESQEIELHIKELMKNHYLYRKQWDYNLFSTEKEKEK